MRISDWSSDVCSSDLHGLGVVDIDLVTGKRTRRASLRDHPRHVATCITLAVHNVVFRSLREVEVIIEMSIGIRVARTFGVTLFKDRDVRRQQVQHALPPVVAQCGMKRADDRTRGLTVCHCRSEEPTSELQPLMSHSYAVVCLK